MAFQVHQLSSVGYLAPAMFVPTFAVHHFECRKIFISADTPGFADRPTVFADENISRNIIYRDQLSCVATSNTVVKLTMRWRAGPGFAFEGAHGIPSAAE
jgi:hypothetical protein